jgi:hypothetical protein
LASSTTPPSRPSKSTLLAMPIPPADDAIAAREPAEVAVGGDPLASRLDRQRGEVGVGRQVALDARRPTEAGEDVPVALA